MRYPVEILTPDEAARLISACSKRSRIGTRQAALYAVLYRSGLRVSEALALEPRDIHHETGAILVRHGKGDKTRTAGIDPGGLAYLNRWLERRGPRPAGTRLFCTLDGRPLSASYVRAAIKRAAHRAGIEKRVHAHGLRHTHAAELMAEGVPANMIQGQLGHSSLQTTDVYLRHIAPVQRVERIHQREWAAAK